MSKGFTHPLIIQMCKKIIFKYKGAKKTMFTIKTWNIEAMTGYKPITTFYEDFSIADKFGANAILDTYKRAFRYWKHDHKYLTELVLVLNWKIYEHYQKNDRFANIYNDLWNTASQYAEENLKGEALQYYYSVTD